MPDIKSQIQKAILFLCLSMALTSCATMQTIPPEQRSRTFRSDYQSTFAAVVNYCNDRAFAITMVDKDLGIINTDYKENDATSRFFLGNYRSKLNVSITKSDPTSTRVLVTASVQKQAAFGSWTQSTMLEQDAVSLYQQIFSGIESHLQYTTPGVPNTNVNTAKTSPVQQPTIDRSDSSGTFTINLLSEKPQVILGGRVSLVYHFNSSGISTLSAKGIWGFATFSTGPFDNSSFSFLLNDTFYMQTDESNLYKISVVEENQNDLVIIINKYR